MSKEQLLSLNTSAHSSQPDMFQTEWILIVFMRLCNVVEYKMNDNVDVKSFCAGRVTESAKCDNCSISKCFWCFNSKWTLKWRDQIAFSFSSYSYVSAHFGLDCIGTRLLLSNQHSILIKSHYTNIPLKKYIKHFTSSKRISSNAIHSQLHNSFV